MKEHSSRNPEISFNFKLKNSIKSSSWDFVFNQQNLSNIQTQDYECIFLKSSEIINTPCTKPIVSKMINFDRVSQILFDDADHDTISSSYVNGSTVASTNLSFVLGESGRFDASLVPKPSSSNRYYTRVRKSADVPPEIADLPHQNGAQNANNNANGNNIQNNANVGGEGLDDSDSDSDSDDGEVDGVELLIVHIHNAEEQLIEMLLTHIAANQYDSWDTFAEAIYEIWRKEYGNANAPDPVAGMDPSRCWPGSFTVFGRLDGDENFTNLNWPGHAWQTVREQINCLRVFATATMR